MRMAKPKLTDAEIDFLRESNAIEGVYDEDSLKQATIAWEYLKTEKELTSGVILKTHKILMLHQPLRPYERGYFRDVPVYIGGREAMEASKIEDAIRHWCRNVYDLIRNGKGESQIHLERITQQHHVLYEKIHPFVDGNGRTGRMFMNWERLKLGLDIQIIWEAEKYNYYAWFK